MCESRVISRGNNQRWPLLIINDTDGFDRDIAIDVNLIILGGGEAFKTFKTRVYKPRLNHD